MTIAEKLQRVPMTRAEFDRLPEGPPFYDYVHGEAIEVNRPSGKHQLIVVRLTSFLWEHVADRDLGEVHADIDVELPTGNVYGPDIIYYSKEQRPRYDEEKGDFYGVPDLVVEVLSPTTAAYDRVEKFADYQAAGVRWVWFIDQDSLTIEEYQWTADGYLWLGACASGQGFHPHLFPHLEIDLSRLVRRR